jgi:hypothetical protein
VIDTVAVARPTAKLCAEPIPAPLFPVAATCAIRVHVPTPVKLTVEPLTVQTEFVEEVMEKTAPFPEVLKFGVK